MNKILGAVRKLTDRPTFLTNMATLFAIFIAMDSFTYAAQDHNAYGWVMFTVVLVASLLTLLAAHDDYQEFIAHSMNRQKKGNT